MTIIYSNRLDDDCQVLQDIWRNIPDANVIEIIPGMTDCEDMVDNAISNEQDTLILIGHGSIHGLYYPCYESGEYIVHENNAKLINARRVICCWCYASSFVVSQNLHAFATSMFISNVNEAYDNCITGYNQEQINACGHHFYQEINSLIINNVPMCEWVIRLGAHVDVDNAIDLFNRQGLYYQ